MRPWILAVLSLGGCLLAAPTAPAGFAFTLTGLPDGLNIITGQTVPVNVYVVYDGTGPSTLLGAGPALRESATDTGSASALTGVGNVAAFEQTNTFLPGTLPPAVFPVESGFINLAAINETSSDPVPLGQGPNPMPPGLPPGAAGFTYLGTFNLTATSAEGTQIVLRASARNPAGGDFVAGDGTTLPNPTPFDITLTVVPEPGSMALVGMAATGFGGLIWRRRRAQRTETPAEVA